MTKKNPVLGSHFLRVTVHSLEIPHLIYSTIQLMASLDLETRKQLEGSMPCNSLFTWKIRSKSGFGDSSIAKIDCTISSGCTESPSTTPETAPATKAAPSVLLRFIAIFLHTAQIGKNGNKSVTLPSKVLNEQNLLAAFPSAA